MTGLRESDMKRSRSRRRRPGRYSWVVLIVATMPISAQEWAPPADRFVEENKQIRREKFDLVLPEIMRQRGVDMWIHVMREAVPDSLGIEEFGSASGVFVFTDRGGDRIERAVLGRRWGPTQRDWGETDYRKVEESGAYDIVAEAVRVQEPVGGPLTEYDFRFEGLREFVEERDPRVIAVNFKHQLGPWVTYRGEIDGISHTDYLLLTEELGEPYTSRIVSAEYLMMDYTIHKVPSEIELLKRMRREDLERLEEAFAAIEPGVTTVEDSEITVFRRMRSGESQRGRSAAWEGAVVERGDILAAPMLGVYAYVLREGETEPPGEIQRLWKEYLRVDAILAETIRAGRTPREIIDDYTEKFAQAGIVVRDNQLHMVLPKNDFAAYVEGFDTDKTHISIDSHGQMKGARPWSEENLLRPTYRLARPRLVEGHPAAGQSPFRHRVLLLHAVAGTRGSGSVPAVVGPRRGAGDRGRHRVPFAAADGAHPHRVRRVRKGDTMTRRFFPPGALLATVLTALFVVTDASASGSYDDLVELFEEFREFQQAVPERGVREYTPSAVEAEYEGLQEFRRRLAAFEVAVWPVWQQVDYHLVRAEMNALEFHHRVLRPWARDPGFYSALAGDAGASMESGGFMWRLFEMEEPLSEYEQARIGAALGAMPAVYEEARSNLTEGSRDLAELAIRNGRREVELYEEVADRLEGRYPGLATAASAAGEALAGFIDWVAENEHRMTAPGNVGRDNYSWWMRNVQLFPWGWEESNAIIQREYDRVITFLKLEEHRNRDLPALEPAMSMYAYEASVHRALHDVVDFLRDSGLMTVPDWADPADYTGFSTLEELDEALGPEGRETHERLLPENSSIDTKVRQREMLPGETHEYIGHMWDEQRHERQTKSPIRAAGRRFNMGSHRLEGWAVALEELLMQAGVLDDRPRRGREMEYLMNASHMSLAIPDMKMAAQEITLAEARELCAEIMPRGWSRPDEDMVWFEMQSNIRNPGGFHSNVVTGKAYFMKLFRERAQALGDDFVIRDFIDEFLDSGIIPMSLVRWELTGDNGDVTLETEPLPTTSASTGDRLRAEVPFDSFFAKRVDVFGIPVHATAASADDKVLHAAGVLAQYLDNDEDGRPDDPHLVATLRERDGRLMMSIDRGELDEVFDRIEAAYPGALRRAAWWVNEDGITVGGAVWQDLATEETVLPDDQVGATFDGALEEVWHLVSHVGLANAYPEAFAEAPGSRLGDAMDIARGGRFPGVPELYPEGAHYTYYDPTCVYQCQAAEYIYWALTSWLGGQSDPERAGRIRDEWRLTTRDSLAEGDPAVHALLTDPRYRLPTVLPDGRYDGFELKLLGVAEGPLEQGGVP